MAVCSHCGATTSPEHAFCLNCGSELPEPEPGEEITQENEPIPDSASVTFQCSPTSPTYHPSLPMLPVINGVITGGVLSPL